MRCWPVRACLHRPRQWRTTTKLAPTTGPTSVPMPPSSSALFEARAAQLVSGRSGGWARGFASGMLIGAEIAEMAPRGPVVVIGAPDLAARYDEALTRCGVQGRYMDGEACAIAGLRLLDED